MGYAKLGQDAHGIHTRLYSRALVVVDEAGSRVCYVNVDLCGSTQIVKLLVRQPPPDGLLWKDRKSVV